MSGSPGLPLGRSRVMVNLMANAGIELDEVDDALGREAVELRDRLARQHARSLHPLVRLALAEDDVEGDQVDAGVLAAHRLRELRELHYSHRLVHVRREQLHRIVAAQACG